MDPEKETRRLIGLSDGLFATVLTLLVLDLRIPDLLSSGDGNPNTFLKWIGPHLFSYLLTFLVLQRKVENGKHQNLVYRRNHPAFWIRFSCV